MPLFSVIGYECSPAGLFCIPTWWQAPSNEQCVYTRTCDGPHLADETVTVVLAEPATLRLTLAITRGVGNYPVALLVGLDEERTGVWQFESNTTDEQVFRMYHAAVDAFLS